MSDEKNLDLDIPDDALTEIQELAPHLTDKEVRYVYWRSMANPPLQAFRKAGYEGSVWRAVETRPKIRTALQDLNDRLEPSYRIDRQKIIGILMEAVELARIKEQPKVLVEAARELADITGERAAARFEIDSKFKAQISVNKTEVVQQKALQHLPYDQLEALVGVHRTLPAQIIEAEFEEIQAEIDQD